MSTTRNSPEKNSHTKLLLATHNKGKAREFTQLLVDVPFDLVTLDDVGISQDVEETGHTFQENAVLKAKAYAQISGLPTMSEDSGIEVDALGGEPGYLSARYGGPGLNDADRVALLLKNLQNIPDGQRSARFLSVIALVWPSGDGELHEGRCEGVITRAPVGGGGFGYDPIFFMPEFGMTTAEMSPEQKNQVSHRGQAAHKALESLKRYSLP